MKNTFRISTFLFLLALSVGMKAQAVAIVCSGTSVTITATNPSSLTNLSYSLMPGNIVSPTATFVVTPTVTTNYTLFTTGLNASLQSVTTATSALVGVNSVSYSVSSPNNFTLGCGISSVAVINIQNATPTNTLQLPTGGAVSYTILAPGNNNNIGLGLLSSVSVYSYNAPGTYTVAVRDNNNLCTHVTTLALVSNTIAPLISNLSILQNTVTCTNSVCILQMPNNSSVQYKWLPSGSTADSISVVPNQAAPIPSVAATVTLEVTSINNLCVSNTVITVYQNIYRPNAIIYGPPFMGTCASSVVLTNISTTGIPSNIFSSTAAVVASVWLGPSPQPSLSLVSSFTAQTPGVYTMVATDLNNGCANTATYTAIIGANAAFTHTVTNGLASFNDASSGVGPNTSFYWDFGDGSTSNVQNPIHQYLSGGAHIVKFRLSNSGGLCMDSVLQSVNVSGIPCVANSNFNMVPTATAQVWNVVPASPWNVSAATWTWGDGSSSNTLYSSHQYSAAGMYNICLTVTVSCAATSSTCASYSVYRSSAAAQIIEVIVTAPEKSTGLANVETDELLNWVIAPNPNDGRFAVQMIQGSAEDVSIYITDLTGRLVYTEHIQAGTNKYFEQELDLNAGLYFVSVEAKHVKTTKRMVVTH